MIIPTMYRCLLCSIILSVGNSDFYIRDVNIGGGVDVGQSEQNIGLIDGGTSAIEEEENEQQQQQQGNNNKDGDNTLRFFLPGASGSGPFEALKDWIAAFKAKYPEADLSVSSVGSGAAQAALWGEVDCDKKPIDSICPKEENENQKTIWGMGGGTIDDEHYDFYKNLGLQQLPALGGPILITFSKDVTGDLGLKTSKQLNLSLNTVAGIFNNTILYWNDMAIKNDNPDLASELPPDRITVVVRSDKSGMSQTLTEAIHHAIPTWPDDGVGKKPSWPLTNLTHSTAPGLCDAASVEPTVKNFKADGQTGIGVSLLRRPSSVGYLELGYFSTLSQFVAQASISSAAHPRSFVQATVSTLRTTMGGLADKLDPNTLSLTLVDQDTPLGGYPISRYVYWYIKKDGREYESCYQAWLVVKFIEWTYTDPLAAEIAIEHGWVVPPEEVVEKALEKLREVQCPTEEGGETIFVTTYTPARYIEPPMEKNHLKQGIRMYGFALASVTLLMSLGFAIWTRAYRKSSVVRSSQPFFLFLICTGVFVFGSSIFPMSIDDAIASPKSCSRSCMAIPWLIAIGWTFIFSALHAKLRRINIVFQNASKFKRIKVTEKDVMPLFFILMSVNVVLLAAWTIFDPLTWVRRETSDNESYGTCTQSDDSKLWKIVVSFLALTNGVALVSANIEAYKARKISDKYGESNFIGLIMGSILQVVLVGVPLMFLVTDPTAIFFVRSSLAFIISMSVLLLLFVPKVMAWKKSSYNMHRSGTTTRRTTNIHTTFETGGDHSNGRSSGGRSRLSSHLSFDGLECSAIGGIVTTDDSLVESLRWRIKQMEDYLKEAGIDSVEFSDRTNYTRETNVSGVW